MALIHSFLLIIYSSDETASRRTPPIDWTDQLQTHTDRQMDNCQILPPCFRTGIAIMVEWKSSPCQITDDGWRREHIGEERRASITPAGWEDRHFVLLGWWLSSLFVCLTYSNMKKSKHESVHTLFFFFYGMSSVLGYNHNIVQRYIAEGKVGGVLFFLFFVYCLWCTVEKNLSCRRRQHWKCGALFL